MVASIFVHTSIQLFSLLFNYCLFCVYCSKYTGTLSVAAFTSKDIAIAVLPEESSHNDVFTRLAKLKQ